MASLFKSISNLFRSKKNDLASALADPVRDGKLAIEDSEKEIRKFTDQIARLMAETKKLERDRDAAAKDQDKFMAIAQKAAASGNEDDARQALEMKIQAASRLTTFTADAEKNSALVKQLREQLNRARAKVAESKNNLTRLEARSNAAKLRKDFAQASSKFNSGNSALASLDDLEKAVNTEESEAEAFEELAQSEYHNSSASLEDKYSSASSGVDDELAALMAGTKK
jgi:phage shock protein A